MPGPAHVQGFGPSSRAAIILRPPRLRGSAFGVSPSEPVHPTGRSPSPEPCLPDVLQIPAPRCAGAARQYLSSPSRLCSRRESGRIKPPTTLMGLCPSRLESGSRGIGLPLPCPRRFSTVRSIRSGPQGPRGSFSTGRGALSRGRRPPWALSPLARLRRCVRGSGPGSCLLLARFHLLAKASPALRADRGLPEFRRGGLSVRRVPQRPTMPLVHGRTPKARRVASRALRIPPVLTAPVAGRRHPPVRSARFRVRRRR